MSTGVARSKKESVDEGAVSRRISDHLNKCLQCLTALARQRESLARSGCAECQDLLAEAGFSQSPLRSLHFSPEMIEEHFFGRLNECELRIFNLHAANCSTCAAMLHNERMFLFALEGVLASNVHLDRNRDGALFVTAA